MATSNIVVDGALIYILALCALLFFSNIFVMLYFLVRFRRARNPLPRELPANRLLETIWVIVPTLLALSMFVYGLTGFRFLRSMPVDSITVKVRARQFSWLFEYANGKKSPNLIVPLGKNIRCELTSADVIHGFYIPAFRIQQDVVPGIKTQVWFNATALGNYTILCSQYCGRQHSAMLARLVVVPPDQFDAWMQGKNIQFGADFAATMPKGQALLYERGCMSCHSLTGTAMVGPTLKGLFGARVRVRTGGQERTLTADSAYIRTSILEPGADIVTGFPNTMPSGKEALNEAEIDTVMQYLKTVK